MKKLTAPIRWIERAAAWTLIALVRVYQRGISPLLPRTCRFRPTCSEYMVQAVRKKGPVVGLLLGIWRIIRCNPFFPGGYDPLK